MTEQKKGGRTAVEIGPTGRTVAANIARLRKRSGLTVRVLADKVTEAGRPVSQSSLTRMERGERIVTADDLTALAVVFGVSPAALLLPIEDNPAAHVDVTGAGRVPADAAWAWASNEQPLQGGNTHTAAMEYALASLPPNRREARQHPAGQAVEAVRADVTRLVGAASVWVEGTDRQVADLADRVQGSLQRVQAEVDRAVAGYEEMAQMGAETSAE
ncbi:helix-turn-helix domain-containing protein [Streptomyces africanus]|uniref:helix-turn-helix domain-containing protein n=1 Tax=Streptomyces africanus TaxID=231024 RepID=UPI0013020E4B|nr:helix-turn-helix transcriptional regulator [Streptomyces africanus]